MQAGQVGFVADREADERFTRQASLHVGDEADGHRGRVRRQVDGQRDAQVVGADDPRERVRPVTV
jgi:hypothetical protein